MLIWYLLKPLVNWWHMHLTHRLTVLNDTNLNLYVHDMSSCRIEDRYSYLLKDTYRLGACFLNQGIRKYNTILRLYNIMTTFHYDTSTDEVPTYVFKLWALTCIICIWLSYALWRLCFRHVNINGMRYELIVYKPLGMQFLFNIWWTMHNEDIKLSYCYE